MKGGRLFARLAAGVRDTVRLLSPDVRAERAYTLGRERLIEDASSRAWNGERWLVGPAYGRGMDERVVEYPWIHERLRRGSRLVDVGSTLNRPWHIRALRRTWRQTVFLNPFPDEEFLSREEGILYVRADVRNHGLQARSFEAVTCVSVLEHVGCDNTRYGGPSPEPGDRGAARADAMRAMRALLAPGGRLLLTVPFGRFEDLGWAVQFDGAALDAAVAAFGPAVVARDYFLYRDGWVEGTAFECADASYGTGTRGASAVACLALEPVE